MNLTSRVTSDFAQYGISDSAGSLLYGVGTDFNTSNRYFIVLNGIRTNVGAAISGDDLETLSLVLDSATGQAELFVNSVSFGSATSSSGAGLITELVSADILYHRSASQFTGAGVYEVDTTTIPEPSSTALLGLGSLALILNRKK